MSKCAIKPLAASQLGIMKFMELTLKDIEMKTKPMLLIKIIEVRIIEVGL